jgi:hypothetical protein
VRSCDGCIASTAPLHSVLSWMPTTMFAGAAVYRHVFITHTVDPGPPSQPLMPASRRAGRHCTQVWARTPTVAGSQMGLAELLEQSVSLKHSTHAFAAVSQTIAPASGHCALLTQPGPHVWDPRRQTGADDLVQSGLARQVTHVLVAVSQRGIAVPAQSPSEAHITHCCVVGSHTRRPAGQSVPVTQPTHAPEVVSQ